MLWHKEILTPTITAGTGAGNTVKLRGRIEQLVVTAFNGTAEQTGSQWTVNILDKDDDKLLSLTNVGRLDDRTFLPVGRDVSEKLTVQFTSISGTVDTMRVFMKVREMVS